MVRRVRFVTLIGLVVNVLLTVAKAVGGVVFRSQALIADAVHSLSDLATDLAVIFGVKYWSAPPDSSHPYGHGKIETLVSAFIGIALALVALGLVSDAVATLRSENDSGGPGLPAFFIALFSVFSKEWLFRWTRREARKLNSKAGSGGQCVASPERRDQLHSRRDCSFPCILFPGSALHRPGGGDSRFIFYFPCRLEDCEADSA